MIFEVQKCEKDSAKQVTCQSDFNLDQFELVVLYNREYFDTQSSQALPIVPESVIEHFSVDKANKYALKSLVTQKILTERAGLFRTQSSEFYDFSLGEMQLARNPYQSAFVRGEVNLTRDRISILRTRSSLWEVLAFIGGLSLILYLITYALTHYWIELYRKIDTILQIFYFSLEQGGEIKNKSLGFRVKAELSSRKRFSLPSILRLFTARGREFMEKVNQG